MKKCILLFLLLANSLLVQAQLTLTPNQTAAQLMDYITGTHVTVSNAVLNCPAGASGLFQILGSSNLNLESGIVLTTGAIQSGSGGIGINGSAGSFASNDNGGQYDPDISAIIGAATYNACRLDFDFVSTFDTVLFYYSFGSEEYPTYNCTAFNDAFAFLVSGPGLTGIQNIAQVPGTTIPVSINSINDGSNTNSLCTSLGPGAPFTQYYFDNIADTMITYNGFTTVLEAKAPVISGLTYHMTMVVADASDVVIDSGVFIRGSSFTSKPAGTTSIPTINKDNIYLGPNPFKEQIKVYFPAELSSEIFSVRMMNEMGQTVVRYNGKGEGLNAFLNERTGLLKAGLYFMEIGVPMRDFHRNMRVQKGE